MRRFVLAIAVVLAVGGASPLLAQQASSGMQGKVIDESGLALPGVTIVVTHEQSGMFRQVVSNTDGTYYLTGVLPGPYRIVAELGGFAKFERSIQLTVGNMSAVDITMKVGGLEESLTVTGQAPLVDTQTTQVGANISNDELQALPISNRNWTMAVGLTPGVQVSQSSASFACDSLIVGGGSNRSGNFAVDGVGNNDDYLGSSCGSQVRPALEAVQEFQVLTNQYDAEFGRSAGAIINAITKQGGNALHGSLHSSDGRDRECLYAPRSGAVNEPGGFGRRARTRRFYEEPVSNTAFSSPSPRPSTSDAIFRNAGQVARARGAAVAPGLRRSTSCSAARAMSPSPS